MKPMAKSKEEKGHAPDIMELEQQDELNIIEFKFNPSWEYLVHMWDFIYSLLNNQFDKHERVGLIAMSINELLENAVKYHDRSVPKSSRGVRFKLIIDKLNRQVICDVSNPATSEHLEIFQKEYESVQTEDTKDILLEKLERAATREDGKSQLGLIRVRHEGKGDMKVSVVKNIITITTVFKLD